MSKHSYEYNTDTLSYEIVSIPLKKKLLRWSIWTLAGMVFFTAVILLLSRYVDTPKTILLRHQIESLQMKYASLLLQMRDKDHTLDEMMHRDNSVYRSIFEAEKLPVSMREGIFEDVQNHIAPLDAPHGEIVWQVATLLNKITQKTYIQSKSFDEISNLALQKEQMMRCIPSIQPVNLSDRRIHISAMYGWRRDPIHRHLQKMHDGIDFAGPVGMPVYATGNGSISAADYNFNGYGNHVIINHGFGYKTCYAHLSRLAVREGDIVARGAIIGYLGSTGKSTGPHLHYEVRYHNRAVNPVNFFSDDITAQEFDKIIKALQGDLRGGTD